MRRGLVIGKFMPVHKGHVALIEFACSHCDELIVSMSFMPHDPIAADLRFDWLARATQHLPKVRVYQVLDDFDDERLAIEARTALWSEFISATYPPMDVVISSEGYGAPFAEHLGALHLPFDPERKSVPISASMIRARPMTNWQFITDAAKPFFVKKICLFGPESTGKSTLAIRLADRYNTVFVPEVAREMLTTNSFSVDEIIAIGKAHDERIRQQTKVANKLLFCDTDAITTQIYSSHYLGVVPDILYELERKTPYDLYFMMDIDVPWVDDGLRDLGHRRDEMRKLFTDALEQRGIRYVLVQGDFHAREELVVRIIDELLAAS